MKQHFTQKVQKVFPVYMKPPNANLYLFFDLTCAFGSLRKSRASLILCTVSEIKTFYDAT